MSIELRILSGSRAGQSELYEKSVIAVGRHPMSDLRFDATQDIDVSARHGEIRGIDGRYTVYDNDSTNGTFVNGERVPGGGSRELRSGDVIAFGAHGPTVSVRIADSRTTPIGDRVTTAIPTPPVASAAVASTAPRRPTSERVAIAVAEQTRGLKMAMGLGVVVLAGVGIGLYWMGHREAAASDARLREAMAAYDASTKQLQSRLAPTNDTALINTLQRRNDSLVRLAQSARGAQAGVVQQALQRQQDVNRAIDQMDLPSVRAANNAAVALIRSDIGTQRLEATGFGVTASGGVITNKHVVIDGDGNRASRVLVKFADTDVWHPAHVARVSSDTSTDLALLQIDDKGAFPVVKGVSSASNVTEGSTIASLGFPLGSDTPMDGLIAKTTLTPGTVSKSIPEVLQIDSYATHGSSGSPVFDGRGEVVGVIYAGPKEAAGRIIYAVPAAKVRALLK
jgi:S1-C subfamily serine protease